MRVDVLKKCILLVCVVALILFAGYWLGSRNVSDDGDRDDTVGGYIQSAQQQAGGAAEALERADGANRDAQKTAGDIAEGNRDIETVNGSIADLIEAGQRILKDIRSRGEEDP